MSNASYRQPNHAAARAELARLERLATLLDARFRIPGLGVRFGADSLVGLIPGVGDVATFLPAMYLLWRAYRVGAPLQDVASMGANVAVDTVVGSVPIVGDLFDLGFKANRRNVAILRRHLQERERASASVETRAETQMPNQLPNRAG
jgi:hypothetical protein